MGGSNAEHVHEHMSVNGETHEHNHAPEHEGHSHSHSHGHSHGHGHGHSHGGHGHSHAHEGEGHASGCDDDVEEVTVVDPETGARTNYTVSCKQTDKVDGSRHTTVTSLNVNINREQSVDADERQSLLSGASAPIEVKRRRKAKRALVAALIFCIIFMVLEAVGGWFANSIAVMTDAAHVATDVAALGLSLYALHAAERPPCSKYTYGWHRIEIVGALVSLLTIWFLTGIIVYESIQRMLHKHEVNGPLMMILGGAGLVVNIVVACILHYGNSSVMHFHSHGEGSACGGHGHGHGNPHGGHGHSHGHSHDHSHAHNEEDDDTHSLSTITTVRKGENVNVKSAMIHAIGDCIQSIGVMIAAAVIWAGNELKYHTTTIKESDFNYADPITSFVFAAVTLWTTAGMFRQVFNVLLESSGGLPYDTIASEFRTTFGTDKVHDLHLWSLTINKPALSVHIVSDDHVDSLYRAKSICSKYEIHHTTIQIDPTSDGKEKCISGICH